MLYKRCIELTRHLLSLGKPVTIAVLSERFGVSKRTIRNDLDVIDEWMASFSENRLIRKSNVGISLHDPDGAIRDALVCKGTAQYVANKQERQYCILGTLLGGARTNLVSLSELFDVSQTTVSADVREVKRWLRERQIHLVAKPHLGIYVEDAEESIRRGFVMLLRDILETKAKQNVLIEQRFQQCEEALEFYCFPASFRNAYSRWRKGIWEAIEELKAKSVISDGGFCFMWECLLVSLARILDGHALDEETVAAVGILENREGHLIEDIKKMSARLFHMELPAEEVSYLAAVWQSLRKFGTDLQVGVDYVVLAKELIQSIQNRMESDQTCYEDTILDVATHLYLMRYRLVLNTPIERSETLDEIIDEFPDVYEASRQCLLETMKAYITPKNRATCEAEAPYIAMHVIVGFYKRTLLQDSKRNVILVCGCSVATSKILENRLNTLFSNVNVIGTMSYNEFLANSDSLPCDLVLSTVPLESDRYQCITVNPLLKNDDINRLMNEFVFRPYELEVNTYIGATMNIISRMMELSPEKRLQMTIRLVQELDGEVHKLKNRDSVHLCDVLTQQTVRTHALADDCTQAVRRGAQLLVDAGKISPRDVTQMMRAFRKFGRNVVIDKGVAMPHLLLPGVGIPCMSLIVLDRPINFHNEENDPVSVVMTLVTNSSVAHIGIIEDIFDLLNDPLRKAALIRAGSTAEVLKIIAQTDRRGFKTT